MERITVEYLRADLDVGLYWAAVDHTRTRTAIGVTGLSEHLKVSTDVGHALMDQMYTNGVVAGPDEVLANPLADRTRYDWREVMPRLES